MADTVHPTEIVKELKALRQAPNFFDHAYHGLSHEAVPAYAFEAAERQVKKMSAEESKDEPCVKSRRGLYCTC